MKKTVTVLMAALFVIGSAACTSRPKRQEPPRQSASVTTTTIEDNDPTLAPESGSVSGAPSSLGAPSSGRGH